jgi:hypothetical protein
MLEGIELVGPMVKRVDKYIFSWTELLEAASQRGCIICHALEKKMNLTYLRLFGEEIRNPESRHNIQSSSGFCRLHAARLLEFELNEFHDNYLTAHYFADVLADLLDLLNMTADKDGQRPKIHGKTLRSNLRKYFRHFSPGEFSGGCRICEARKTHEAFLVGEFLRYLDSPEYVEAYRNSSWLCIPHFLQVIEQPLPPAHLNLVFKIELARLGNLLERLEQYQNEVLKVSGRESANWLDVPDLAVQTICGKIL